MTILQMIDGHLRVYYDMPTRHLFEPVFVIAANDYYFTDDERQAQGNPVGISYEDAKNWCGNLAN